LRKDHAVLTLKLEVVFPKNYLIEGALIVGL